MKKILLRALSIFFILLSLALLLFPAWFTLDGFSARETRQLRQHLLEVQDDTKDVLIDNLDYFEDELDDADLPATRKEIKRYFTDLENVTKDVFETEYSLVKLTSLAAKLPGYAEDLTNLASMKKKTLEEIFSFSEYEIAYDIDNLSEEIEVDSTLPASLTSVLVVFALLALAAAVTEGLGRGTFVKYIFFSLVLLLVIAAVVGSAASQDLLEIVDLTDLLPDHDEALSIRLTAFPFLSLVCALMPIILAFFKGKKQKNETAATDCVPAFDAPAAFEACAAPALDAFPPAPPSAPAPSTEQTAL